ncbi:glycosylated lysosomal membrane protein A-like [Leguminivora glycinivorella]|uniref:glycosylated lysosomal membrane protein A-like n=1 Tax=Leguminivora glycinivorella TaxID=1035111 RepID=UPI002010A4FB|nr:glycosylated lysosomal membrane protein A-like [Leguminivora glycinivorella]
MINMHLRTFVLIAVLSLAFGQDRKITSTINPDCDACSSNTTLVYIKAEGSHDTLHQLWDFTQGTPTVIYTVAGVNSSLQVEWQHDKPVKFNMSEDPIYSFAMAISDIYEYNDLEDQGHPNSSTKFRHFPLKDLSWSRQDSICTEQEAMVVMQAHKYSRHRNGTVTIKLDLLPFRDYATQLPHLIHTANSTLIDIHLANLTQSRDFNASRFALRLILVASDDSGAMARRVEKSLDDEHTPGVFEIIEIKTPRCVNTGAGGYMQFRPVAYTQKERSVTSSTVVHVSDFNSTRIVPPSTLIRFYPNIDEMLIEDMIVSFGEPQDGFYRQHNYTAWSTTFGYGSPPIETFSLFVILVITIGLSVPILLALSGVIYVVSKRCRAGIEPARLREE